jgi:predicted TIM-barrel fold metal-dependent hydrolase
MILGGVFDRSPTLQLILGHWGEMIPFYKAACRPGDEKSFYKMTNAA